MPYIDVRQPGTGKLLFKYDPQKGLVEIKINGSDKADTVDLLDVAKQHQQEAVAAKEAKRK